MRHRSIYLLYAQWHQGWYWLVELACLCCLDMLFDRLGSLEGACPMHKVVETNRRVQRGAAPAWRIAAVRIRGFFAARSGSAQMFFQSIVQCSASAKIREIHVQSMIWQAMFFSIASIPRGSEHSYLPQRQLLFSPSSSLRAPVGPPTGGERWRGPRVVSPLESTTFYPTFVRSGPTAQMGRSADGEVGRAIFSQRSVLDGKSQIWTSVG